MELGDRFLIVDRWFDQFNGYGLHERLVEKGLTQFRMQSMSANLNTQLYQTVKTLMYSNLIKLFDHDVLLNELRTLEETKYGGGHLLIYDTDIKNYYSVTTTKELKCGPT